MTVCGGTFVRVSAGIPGLGEARALLVLVDFQGPKVHTKVHEDEILMHVVGDR